VKKRIFLVMIAVVVMLMVSCDTSDIFANPFIGTWQKTSGYPDYETETIIFTKNTFSIESDSKSWGGTYTYDDVEVKFKYLTQNGEEYTGDLGTQYYFYTIDSNGLWICFNPRDQFYKKAE